LLHKLISVRNAMSFTSQNLNLPYIAPAQAQKHVTHNEALRALDAIVQLSLVSKFQTTPPVTPIEGSRYFVAAPATNEWAGQDGLLAAYQDGAWGFYTPQIGWQAWVEDESVLQIWDGAAWQAPSPAPNHQNMQYVGINTTADTTNRLSVSSPSTLLNHAGNGHQLKLNKNLNADTASVLYQSGFSGRAEIGLTGDDDFHFKVSPDGSAWNEGLTLDKSTGVARFPSGIKDPSQSRDVGLFNFVGAITGNAFFYRITAGQAQLPRTSAISTVSGDQITLTSAVDTAKFFTTSHMTGVSYVRVWNTTKSPNESAWVKDIPSSGVLQITDASHISGWSNGDILQIGEPSNTDKVAIDISPLLTTIYGSPVRQKGLNIEAYFDTNTVGDLIAVSDTGLSGTLSNLARAAVAGVSIGNGFVASTQLSPISNSNLIYIREKITTTSNLSSLKVIAVLV
jgi:Protein of unknown function (DUF2793)